MSDNLEKLITQGQTVDLPKEKNHPFSNERTEQSVPTLPTPPIEPTKRSSPKQRKASWRSINKPI